MNARLLLALLALLALAACGGAPSVAQSIPAATAGPTAPGELQLLRLATTTSTADSGLLDAILPDFERQSGINVDVIAVGTGQALTLGEKGDVDVVLVHARSLEDKFVAEGNGVSRRDVMYNDFVVAGPADDPAQIAGLPTALAAFQAIASANASFAARGDSSGTATREEQIWKMAGLTPTPETGWYKSLGQGMGETLTFADEQRAYTLTDRGTFLSMADKLPNLRILVGGASIAENKDPDLLNPYGAIVVNPATHPGVRADLAQLFVDWLVAPATQRLIGDYGSDRFGQPLFYPGAPG